MSHIRMAQEIADINGVHPPQGVHRPEPEIRRTEETPAYPNLAPDTFGFYSDNTRIRSQTRSSHWISRHTDSTAAESRQRVHEFQHRGQIRDGHYRASVAAARALTAQLSERLVARDRQLMAIQGEFAEQQVAFETARKSFEEKEKEYREKLHRQEIDLKAECKKEMDQQRADQDTKFHSLSKELAAAKKKAEDLEKDLDAEKELARRLEDSETKLSAEKAKLEEQHKAELENLKKTHEDALKKATEDLKKMDEELRNQQEDHSNTLIDVIKERDDAAKEAFELKKERGVLAAKASELRRQLKTAEQALEVEKKRSDGLEQQKNAHRLIAEAANREKDQLAARATELESQLVSSNEAWEAEKEVVDEVRKELENQRTVHAEVLNSATLAQNDSVKQAVEAAVNAEKVRSAAALAKQKEELLAAHQKALRDQKEQSEKELLEQKEQLDIEHRKQLSLAEEKHREEMKKEKEDANKKFDKRDAELIGLYMEELEYQRDLWEKEQDGKELEEKRSLKAEMADLESQVDRQMAEQSKKLQQLFEDAETTIEQEVARRLAKREVQLKEEFEKKMKAREEALAGERLRTMQFKNNEMRHMDQENRALRTTNSNLHQQIQQLQAQLDSRPSSTGVSQTDTASQTVTPLPQDSESRPSTATNTDIVMNHATTQTDCEEDTVEIASIHMDQPAPIVPEVSNAPMPLELPLEDPIFHAPTPEAVRPSISDRHEPSSEVITLDDSDEEDVRPPVQTSRTRRSRAQPKTDEERRAEAEANFDDPTVRRVYEYLLGDFNDFLFLPAIPGIRQTVQRGPTFKQLQERINGTGQKYADKTIVKLMLMCIKEEQDKQLAEEWIVIGEKSTKKATVERSGRTAPKRQAKNQKCKPPPKRVRYDDDGFDSDDGFNSDDSGVNRK